MCGTYLHFCGGYSGETTMVVGVWKINANNDWIGSQIVETRDAQRVHENIQKNLWEA